MRFSIEGLKDREVEATVDVFSQTIDELHPTRTPQERQSFKEAYTPSKVRKRLASESCIYLLAKEDGNIVGYMFAWITEGVGNIHWFAITREHRGKGYGKKLLEQTLLEFQKRQCYESRIFIYPQDTFLQKLLEGLGYTQKAFIEEEYFGVDLILMVKPLVRLPRPVVKRIVLAGEAGQGIKLLAHALANILAKMGKEVSMNVLYDATVRGGEITAELVFSDEKIDVPFFEKADLCLLLSRTERRAVSAERQIMEAAIAEAGPSETRAAVPFEHEAVEKFGSPIFLNMIALGRLLRDIGIPIDKVDFRSWLPARFLEENIRAIKYGYTFQE